MKFVIASTGRAGSKWCATALRLAGIRCGHEQVFATAMLPAMDPPRWDAFEGDSSLAVVPYLDRLPEGCYRLHVVRHPLAVIGSFVHNGPILASHLPAGLGEYLDAAFSEITDAPDEVTAASLYWLRWNRWAEKDSDRTMQLESLTPETLVDAVWMVPRWPLYPFDNPVNVSAATPIALDDIPDPLRDEVADAAEWYGYDPERVP